MKSLSCFVRNWPLSVRSPVLFGTQTVMRKSKVAGAVRVIVFTSVYQETVDKLLLIGNCLKRFFE